MNFEIEDILDPVEAIKREGLRAGKRKIQELYSEVKNIEMPSVKRARKMKSRIVTRIPRSLRPELKSVDTLTSGGPTGISTTMTIYLLNAIAPGTDFSNRAGLRIFLKSVAFRGVIFNNVSNPAVEDWVRFLIVYDRQAQAGTPTWLQIMNSYDTTGATSSDALSFPNVANSRRFKIVRDWMVKLPATGALGVIGTTKTVEPTSMDQIFEQYAKINKETEYLTGGSATQISSGALYVCWKSQNVGVGNPAWSMSMNARVRYTDA